MCHYDGQTDQEMNNDCVSMVWSLQITFNAGTLWSVRRKVTQPPATQVLGPKTL